MKLLLSVGLIFAAPAALAAMTASASVSNLHFELTDLDPNDGIAPSLLLELDRTPYSVVAAGVAAKHAFTTVAVVEPNFGSWGAGTVRPGAASNAFLKFNDVSSSLEARGQINNSAPDQISFFGISFAQFSYTVSPKTAVKWTAEYDLQAFTDISSKATRDEWASAQIYGSPQETVKLEVFANPDFGPNSLSQHGTIEWSYSNEDSVLRGDRNSLGVMVRGGIVPSVPEPQSWLMMLAGFGALGAVARRRREHAQ